MGATKQQMMSNDPPNWRNFFILSSFVAVATKTSSASAFCTGRGPPSLPNGVGSRGVRPSIESTRRVVFPSHDQSAAAEERRRRRRRWSSSLKYRAAIDDDEREFGYGVESDDAYGHIDAMWRDAILPAARESGGGRRMPQSGPGEEANAIPRDCDSRALPPEPRSSSVLDTTTISDDRDVPSEGVFIETARAFIPVALEFGVVAAAVATNNAWN